MFLTKRLAGFRSAHLVMRQRTEERLRTTCFRGTSQKLAGNFRFWDSPKALFEDEYVVDQLLQELVEMWGQKDLGTHSLTITHELPIGWESTDSIEKYQMDDLEEFHPNRKGRALRVRLDRTEILAPQTHDLTIVFELKNEDGVPVLVIYSVYPGRDIGELVGDVTGREKRVFFGWNHPGKT